MGFILCCDAKSKGPRERGRLRDDLQATSGGKCELDNAARARWAGFEELGLRATVPDLGRCFHSAPEPAKAASETATTFATARVDARHSREPAGEPDNRPAADDENAEPEPS